MHPSVASDYAVGIHRQYIPSFWLCSGYTQTIHTQLLIMQWVYTDTTYPAWVYTDTTYTASDYAVGIHRQYIPSLGIHRQNIPSFWLCSGYTQTHNTQIMIMRSVYVSVYTHCIIRSWVCCVCVYPYTDTAYPASDYAQCIYTNTTHPPSDYAQWVYTYT